MARRSQNKLPPPCPHGKSSILEALQIEQLNVQKDIRYTFHNPDLLLEALEAAYSRDANPNDLIRADGNRRLAIVGDAVLKLAVAMKWIRREESREVFSHELEQVGSNRNLNVVGRRNGLGKYVNKNPVQKGVVGLVTMATTVEAILGAVWIDSGYDIEEVRDVMEVWGC